MCHSPGRSCPRPCWPGARSPATSQDQVRTPDGQLIEREYLKHPGAVGVIALDDHDRVALVRQYRHPVRHRLIEPPAGLLDVGGEDYLQAIERELAEEVRPRGQDAGPCWWTCSPRRAFLANHCGSISPATWWPSTARTVSPARGEEAHMDTVWATLDDLVEAVLDGRLHNPTMVSGVLAAWTARQRDGFMSLRPADAAWPARALTSERVK